MMSSMNLPTSFPIFFSKSEDYFFYTIEEDFYLILLINCLSNFKMGLSNSYIYQLALTFLNNGTDNTEAAMGLVYIVNKEFKNRHPVFPL